MVKMMDALELELAVKKLQEANPTLQYDTDEFGLIRVNGIEYRGEEYRDLKYPVKSEHPRPTIIEKLGTERIEWHARDMLKFMTEHAMKIREKNDPRQDGEGQEATYHRQSPPNQTRSNNTTAVHIRTKPRTHQHPTDRT